jgi:hypothetical protein
LAGAFDGEGALGEGLSAGVEETGGVVPEGVFVEFAGSAGRMVSFGGNPRGGAGGMVDADGAGDAVDPDTEGMECLTGTVLGGVASAAFGLLPADSTPPRGAGVGEEGEGADTLSGCTVSSSFSV